MLSLTKYLPHSTLSQQDFTECQLMYTTYPHPWKKKKKKKPRLRFQWRYNLWESTGSLAHLDVLQSCGQPYASVQARHLSYIANHKPWCSLNQTWIHLIPFLGTNYLTECNGSAHLHTIKHMSNWYGCTSRDKDLGTGHRAKLRLVA